MYKVQLLTKIWNVCIVAMIEQKCEGTLKTIF